MSLNGEITAVHISRKSSMQSSSDAADKKDDNGSRIRPREEKAWPSSGRKMQTRDRVVDGDNFLRADSDQIDLHKLLHSVLDINDYRNSPVNGPNGKPDKKQRPFSAHELPSSMMHENNLLSNFDDTRSIVSDSRISGRVPKARLCAGPHPLHQNRSNYSFSNEKVDVIDRENQRLLRGIMRNQAKRSSSRQAILSKKPEPVRVKSSALLNRSKFQMQIERENLALLQRLEKVKPTRELSKDHLLREHFRQEQLSCNITKSKRPLSAARLKRSSSLNDVSQIDRQSVASGSVKSSQRPGTARRPISATTLSKTRQFVDNRPMWEAGW